MENGAPVKAPSSVRFTGKIKTTARNLYVTIPNDYKEIFRKGEFVAVNLEKIVGEEHGD